MELSKEKLVDYLSKIVELEKSVNEQERIVGETKQKVVYKEPEKKTIQKPKKPVLPQPIEPYRKDADISGKLVALFLVPSIFILIFSFFLEAILLTIIGGFGIVFGLFLFVGFVSTHSSANKEYQAAVEQYQKDLIEYEKTLKKPMNSMKLN